MEVDTLVRQWIAEIIRAHPALLALAIRQRAKFEGWLKFELAAYAQSKGMQNVSVEAATGDSIRSRGDLTFSYAGGRCDVELKTCNTNWRMPGVLDLTRPITKNIAAVVEDAKKLQACAGKGIIAFCIFPIPCNDMRWTLYLERIAKETCVSLSVDNHSTRVSVSLAGECKADVIVVSFVVAKSALNAIPAASGTA